MNLKEEWNSKGEKYATEINEMVAFGEKHGWENWKGKEPEDKREHLAEEILLALKKANAENKVDEFRKDFPPAHSPFVGLLNKKGQSLEQFCFISGEKIIFVCGTAYQKRKAYILNNDKITEFGENITGIGKSKQNNVFAFATADKITTVQGWEGDLIEEFNRKETKNLGITELIPFNDGKKILMVTSEGIYLFSDKEEKLIHPVNHENEEDWSPNIDMENATLSNNNRYIVVGDQNADHRVLDAEGNQVGSIGTQSEYPHFCLFSKDDSQLISNSCHFYNGLTIGVDTKNLNGINIEPYSDTGNFIGIDDEMRVYQGLSTKDYYILGDAYGYVKAIDRSGRRLWKHFLGSTISGMTISDDEQTLWVGSYSGMVHKLRLGKGHRDKHTIGNGNHYEEFRLLIWKDEPQILKW